MTNVSDLRVLSVALMVVCAACSSVAIAPDGGSDGGAGNGGSGAGGGVTMGGGGTTGSAGSAPMTLGCTPIRASALVGCRSGDEPNCEMCCSPTANGCTVLSLPCVPGFGGVPASGYCTEYAPAGPCPSGCQPCAACSKYSEGYLCSPDIAACDCPHVTIGGDPCSVPGSCACLCSIYLRARAACPPP
jgi:hypothetical protein